MSKPTVYAVMKATIEIPVRSSSSAQTFAQVHEVAKREAEAKLNHLLLSEGVRLVGSVEFSHAIVK